MADSLSALCAMSSRLNDIRFKNLRNFKVLKRSRDGEVGDGEDVPEPVLDLTGVAGLKEEWTERHGSLKSGGTGRVRRKCPCWVVYNDDGDAVETLYSRSKAEAWIATYRAAHPAPIAGPQPPLLPAVQVPAPTPARVPVAAEGSPPLLLGFPIKPRATVDVLTYSTVPDVWLTQLRPLPQDACRCVNPGKCLSNTVSKKRERKTGSAPPRPQACLGSWSPY